MMKKKKQQAQNPILDDKTAQLLFMKDAFVDLDFLDVKIQGTLTIEDLVQNPLTDVGAINERLTTIGELVANPDARKRLEAAVDAFVLFGNNYNNNYNKFYQKAEEYVATQSADVYSRQRVTDELVNLIEKIATPAWNLPVTLGQIQFKSKTLSESAYIFNRMMEENGPARAFFEYVIETNEKIAAIISEKAGNEGISYDQLKGLIDMEGLSKFKQAASAVQAIAFAVSPYLVQAEKAVKEKYCEPIIVPREENCLTIRNGRNRNWRNSVPNHTYLDSRHSVEILEGVNNGGKTFDMKKAFYIAIAALSGSWVPADYARVSVRDKIVLRQKGKGDVISAMQQDCRNVKEATPPDGEYWLIGLDETFTSTERRGGRALLYGLINSVLDQGHSLLITSSHYLGLNSAFGSDGRVAFNHFPFERKKAKGKKIEIVFPYTKRQGQLKDIKYALEVAAANGFDKKVIEYAEQRLAQRKAGEKLLMAFVK